MWWWRKVRWANIPDNLRKELERLGENVVAQAVAHPVDNPSGLPLYGFVHTHNEQTLDWLTERRDIHERREHRLEFVEWSIVILILFEIALHIGELVVKH
ncbi:MAG TPA: hypothetical protein VMH84_00920 [Xanthobacteraceae bacterium]|nr:hypothetical protein [Xanthobacteraceae bacterium]